MEILRPIRLSLPDGLISGFSTRRGGVSNEPFDSLNFSSSTGDLETKVARNTEIWMEALGAGKLDLALPGQIHGAAMRQVEQGGYFERCDALITDTPGILLGIRTADCVPILLWEPNVRMCAAVHSGWRGTKSNILGRTILGLVDKGCDPREIRAVLGPAMRGAEFEVGQEFREIFAPRWLTEDRGKLYFDHFGLLRSQAHLAGITPDHLEDLGEDTYRQADRYFSHRRDGSRTGRMLSVIGWS